MVKKNKYGQYFTRKTIADFMVSLITHDYNCSVLEPSCGAGVFLESLQEKGFTSLSAYEIDKTLHTGTFDFIQYQSFLGIPTTEKYDVIIGNPPYIRWKNLEQELKDELQENALWNKYFNSLCDYLYIFILKSIEHLREGGELIFICSDYWFNTSNSQTLRNYMCKNGYISDIYHFKEASLFDGVTASLAIFRFIKTTEKKPKVNLYSYIGKKMPLLSELIAKNCFIHKQIKAFEYNKKWILAEDHILKDLEKLEQACVRATSKELFSEERDCIGDFCDIGNGMVSGLDKAFQIPPDVIYKLTKTEKQNVVDVLKAKDLDQYVYQTSHLYIFVKEQMSEEEFQQKCPNFFALLQPYKEDLGKRYNYGKDIPYWEFVFPRNETLFSKLQAKIFVPCKERISAKDYVRFCYADIGYYPLQDVTALVKKTNCKESLEYVLAYLNTKVVFEWIKYKGIVKGDIVEFSEAPLASIPYRKINWEDANEMILHEKITQKTREYLGKDDPKLLEDINNLMMQLL